MKLVKKEVTKIMDRIGMDGGLRSAHVAGGLLSKDGGPVDPKLIAKAYKVSIEEAKEISRRKSL
jgi:glycine/D-amino acid oxidase-like deaminating enzyme